MIDLSEIQSTVMRGFRHSDALPYDHHRFVRFGSTASARIWLTHLLPHVTSCSDWDAQPGYARVTINVGFSHAGLRLLAGLGPNPPGAQPAPGYEAFVEGAVARSKRTPAFGDTGTSAWDQWEPHYQAADLHALVSVSASNAPGLAAAVATVDGLTPPPAQLGVEPGARFPGGTEHFGFVDGIGQPDVADSGLPSLPGGGKPEQGGGWSPLASGEFVLGYVDEQEETHEAGSWLQNGSFLVFRKLHQDVAGFRRYLDALASRTGESEALLAAKLVGRWRSGAPLVRAPDADDPLLASKPMENNDFRYAKDKKGRKCPFGAHIRRTNPRDDPSGPTQNQTARHRMIRRSIPYGVPLPLGSGDDAQPRGLLFLAVVASIERQFEFVQSSWINSTISSSALTIEADKDPVVGANDGTGKFQIPAKKGPTFAWDLPRFVLVKGGAYFFLPSLDALGLLAGGTLPGGGWPFFA